MAEAGAGKGQSPPWATPAHRSRVRSGFFNAPVGDVSVRPGRLRVLEAMPRLSRVWGCSGAGWGSSTLCRIPPCRSGAGG